MSRAMQVVLWAVLIAGGVFVLWRFFTGLMLP